MKQYVPVIGSGIIQNIIYSRKLRNITNVYQDIIKENPAVYTINQAVINFIEKNPGFATTEHISNITAVLLYKAIESQLEVEEMEREIKL